MSTQGGLSTTEVVGAVALFVVILVVLGLGVRRWWYEHGHGQSVAAYAKERGLTYVPRDNRQVRDYGFPFGSGRHRRAENIVNGRLDGRLVLAYDYVYDVPHRARRPLTARYAVVFLRLPQALPTLQVVERSTPVADTPDLVKMTVGDAAFDERFEVRTSDTVMAGLVLHGQTRKALLACANVAVRVHGIEAVSWKPGRLDDLAPHLEALCAVADELSLGDEEPRP